MAVCAASVACWPISSAAVATIGSQPMLLSSLDGDVAGIPRTKGWASSRKARAGPCHLVLYYFSAHVAACGTQGERQLVLPKSHLVDRRAAHRKVSHLKEKIHPAWHEAHVVCACGNKFTTGSTRDKLHVEI